MAFQAQGGYPHTVNISSNAKHQIVAAPPGQQQ
jgi:hypothetical protein